MSNDIRRYISIDGDTYLDLTAFVGGKYGKAMQFTITGKENYVRLSEVQLLDLVYTIMARILSKRGFTATEMSDMKIVHPDGTITVDELEGVAEEEADD